MYANWETVEYAKIRLISKVTTAERAAINAVVLAIIVKIHKNRLILQRGRSRKILEIRYTPALTIVAAWMRAETVVGPCMASISLLSGLLNQGIKGN